MSDIAGRAHSGTQQGGMAAGVLLPCSLMVRGKVLNVDPLLASRTIEDGAVCVKGDTILAVGSYEQLREQYRADKEIGNSHHLVMPGLVNAHDHLRAPSALQMGISDDVVEPWLLDLLRLPQADPYLSTAYACTQLIESGVTTVVHSYFEGAAGRYGAPLDATARAYADSGIRAVLALTILDRSIVSSLVGAMLPNLPDCLGAQAREFLGSRRPVSPDEFLAVLRCWHGRRSGRLHVIAGPVSVHWCSSGLLQRIWQEAADLDIAIQTHLLESRSQQAAAYAAYGKSVVEYLDECGLLSPRLSCAHCVWVTERDMELLADRGVSVVHNPSSNLRLSSGTAPVRAMWERGINLALGLDSLALNDDGDMLQEIRFAALLHRASADPGGAARKALAMATVGGARALGMEPTIGTLAPGKRADLILVDLDRLGTPYALPQADIEEWLVQRGKAHDIDTVIVNGELVMHNRVHLKIDQDALSRELRAWWLRGRSADQERMERFIAALKPYARRLVANPAGAGPSPKIA